MRSPAKVNFDQGHNIEEKMEPRRSKLNRWTDIPQDYTRQVLAALNDSFKDELKSGKFIFEGRIYADEILLRMGFIEKGRLRQLNFEVSADLKAGKEDTIKIIGLCVDVGATMLEELFSSKDDSDFPRVWSLYEVEGKKIYIQFSSSNSELDKEADRLLGTYDESLVKHQDLDDEIEDEDQKTLQEIKAKLGLEDEGDFDDTDEDSDDDNLGDNDTKTRLKH